LDLRIIAIFAIAASALLCGLPPLFLRAFQSPDSPVARIARAFAGGVILSLALVHIIPEAVMELNDVIEFPIGGVTVLFGILALVIIDSSLTALWAPEEYKLRLRSAAGSDATGPHAPSHDTVTIVKPLGSHGCASHGKTHAPAAAAAAAVAHTHACTSSLTAQRWLGGTAEPLGSVKQRVTAYTFELGCIFHSVIIGVGVGVITHDRQLVVVLLVSDGRVARLVALGREATSVHEVNLSYPFMHVTTPHPNNTHSPSNTSSTHPQPPPPTPDRAHRPPGPGGALPGRRPGRHSLQPPQKGADGGAVRGHDVHRHRHRDRGGRQL